MVLVIYSGRWLVVPRQKDENVGVLDSCQMKRRIGKKKKVRKEKFLTNPDVSCKRLKTCKSWTID